MMLNLQTCIDNHSLYTLLILVSVLTISGCSTQEFPSTTENELNAEEATPTSLDEFRYDLLSKDPCEAPCWDGVTPGITKREEVKKLLETDSILHTNCTNILESNAEEIICTNFAIIFDASDTIYKIQFLRPTNIELSKIIDEFGSPDELYFEVDKMSGDNNVIITIPYVDRGLWLIFKKSSIDYSVLPEMKPTYIEYWRSGSNDYFTTDYIFVMGVQKASWKGFIDYRSILLGN